MEDGSEIIRSLQLSTFAYNCGVNFGNFEDSPSETSELMNYECVM